MAVIIKDRIKETTSTVSTGNFALAGSVAGYQAFSVLGSGTQTYYCCADQVGSNWEVGIGTYTSSGNYLTRDTILASSNQGSAVNFGIGTKDIFCVSPASKMLFLDNSNNLSISGSLTSASITTSGAANVASVASSGQVSGTNLYASLGSVSTGVYSGTFSDGIITDYTTGFGRFSTGALDGFKWYNNGLAGYQLMSLDTTGNLTTTGTITANGTITATSFSGSGASLTGVVASSTSNIAGGSAGTIPYQSGASATAMLAVGTAGQILTSNGTAAPSWTSPSTLSVSSATTATTATTATNLASGSAGSIPYQSASATTAMLSAGTAGQILRQGASAPSWGSGIVANTTTGTTMSGTGQTIAGIPSWARRVTITLTGVSTASTGVPIIRLGTSGGIVSTGYQSQVSNISTSTVGTQTSSTTGFELVANGAATYTYNAIYTLILAYTNQWNISGQLGLGTTTSQQIATGTVNIAGVLTQLQLTTTGGTDTFDAGTINIFWE